MPKTLSGKTAFITGGSRGIGKAIVQRLASEGANVAFTYKESSAAAKTLVEQIERVGGRAIALQTDAGDAAAISRAIDDAAAKFGRIDILVNNAGVLAWGPIDTFSLEDFDRTLQVNVRAVFVAVKAVLRHMGEGGRIVNISSCNAERMPFPGGATYAMSKSALRGLAQGLARDLGPRGITVNNVQPGPTDTDMNPESGELASMAHGIMAIPRHGRPEEVAAMVAYVVGPEAAFVTAAHLTIDGGFNA